MPNLFLIDGIVGKEQFFETQIDVPYSNFLKKYTTKKSEIDGNSLKSDLEYLTKEEYDRLKDESDFEYRYSERSKIKYLIRKKDLDDALKNYPDVYIILRNTNNIIDKIKKAYESFLNINIITIFIYRDEVKLEEITREKSLNTGIDIDLINKKIENRIVKNRELIDSYIESLNKEKRLYDHVFLAI